MEPNEEEPIECPFTHLLTVSFEEHVAMLPPRVKIAPEFDLDTADTESSSRDTHTTATTLWPDFPRPTKHEYWRAQIVRPRMWYDIALAEARDRKKKVRDAEPLTAQQHHSDVSETHKTPNGEVSIHGRSQHFTCLTFYTKGMIRYEMRWSHYADLHSFCLPGPNDHHYYPLMVKIRAQIHGPSQLSRDQPVSVLLSEEDIKLFEAYVERSDVSHVRPVDMSDAVVENLDQSMQEKAMDEDVSKEPSKKTVVQDSDGLTEDDAMAAIIKEEEALFDSYYWRERFEQDMQSKLGKICGNLAERRH